MNRYAKLDANPEFGFISDYIKHDLDDAVNMQVCEGKTFPTSHNVYVSSSMILLKTNSFYSSRELYKEDIHLQYIFVVPWLYHDMATFHYFSGFLKLSLKVFSTNFSTP